MFTRIIPRLDIKGPNLVKGICFEGLRSLGRPNHYALTYYTDGADEIIINDIVASLYGRENLRSVLKEASKNVFIPITAGGGVRSVEDAKELLRSGADKVIINTAALENPEIINELVNELGSSTICASIEAKEINNNFFCYYNFGRDNSGKNVTEWINEIQSRGIGEISISSVDNDGLKKGFNYKLFSTIKNKCNIKVPILFGSGAGDENHIVEFLKKNNVDGITLGAILHYNNLDKNDEVNSLEGNRFFLETHKPSNRSITIKSIKNTLLKNKLEVRI